MLAGVVMIGGSGASDRSNGGYFGRYRDQFTDHGIAVLWYDKRGAAESTGSWLAGSLDDLATDAAAAVASLRRSLGDDAPVGLFGHSEGGWVALRAAARWVEPAFVVTNSCPATSPAQQDRHAVAAAMAAGRLPDADQAAALRLYDDLADAAARSRLRRGRADLWVVAWLPHFAPLRRFFRSADVGVLEAHPRP